jgi:predicted nucleic acid-binding protein
VKFLVDADVLSEPTKPSPNQRAVEWLRQHERDLAISSIVLGEIEFGILLLPAGRRRTRLQQWFAHGVQKLRTLDFDTQAATEWARLLVRLRKKGHAMPVKDSLIAATALAHGWTVATRNTSDFRSSGVPLVDPFA